MNRTVTSLPLLELTVGAGNYNTTRSPIDRIVIHTMVGSWQAADARFNNTTSQVSAHYGVGLSGKLYHWVDENNTAYHAGDYAMNQRSIGIEHEDGGDYNGSRPEVLYAASAHLVADICRFYQIPCDRTRIRKHSEVSDNPTGCPDALDIERIVRDASSLLTPAPAAPTFNDQTLIPFGGDLGNIELGAVRGQLHDLKIAKVDLASNQATMANDKVTISNLQSDQQFQDAKLTKAQSQIDGYMLEEQKLRQQVADCLAGSTSPKPPPIPAPAPSAGSFIDWLKKLFGGG